MATRDADAVPVSAPRAPPEEAVAAIHLVGDEAVSRSASAYGWPGSGHQDDPYRVRDLEVFVDGRDGIRIESTDAHIVVTGNTVEAFGGAAIRLVAARNVTVHDNTLRGDHAGLVIEGGHGNGATANEITGQETGILFTGGRGHVAADNVLTGQRHALRIDPLDGLDAIGHRVVRNHVRDGGGPSEEESAGIFATGQGHHIAGNRLARSGTAAVWLRDAEDLTVHDNRFEGGAEHAIHVQRSSGGTITANIFSGTPRVAVAIEDSDDLAVRDNAITAPQGAGMTFVRTASLGVHDNTFDTARQGIVAWEDSGSLLRANRFVSVDRPIDLYDCTGTRISTNRIQGATEVALLAGGCDHLELHANHITDTAGSAMFLYDGTSLLVRENVIERVQWGMVIDGVDGIEITRNILRGSGPVGIGLDSSSGRLMDNEVLSYDVGIRIHDAPAVQVQGGSASFTTWGMVLSGGSHGATIEGVHLQEDTYGVSVFGAEAAEIRGNLIERNVFGIVLADPHGPRVSSNKILHNEVGLYLGNTSLAQVWDNLFENRLKPHHRDVRIVGSADTAWNITKRPGENILGGPFIGGNAWHDYNGADVDLDGLGDSPYLPVPCRDPFADPDCHQDIMPMPLDLLPLMEDLVPGPVPLGAERPLSLRINP